MMSNTGAAEGYAVPASYKSPVMLLKTYIQPIRGYHYTYAINTNNINMANS